MEYFKQAREIIIPFLSTWLQGNAVSWGFIDPWGPDVASRLEEFTRNGKMIRGGLTLLGLEMHGGKVDESALRCASAMELFQSGFLIHDDIMDRDRQRRGKPSFFMQYARMAEAGGLQDAYHQGESMGICGGDIALFLGFDLLSFAGAPPDFLGFCTREIIAVGLAQMQDVWYGASPELPSVEQILTVYTHKTGRYSFSLPLMAGAMLAGRREPELAGLSRLGELMGVVFQIRDDELGLFGKEAELGKPIGSDIREGKKTIFYRALLDALPQDEVAGVRKCFGTAAASPGSVETIRALMETSGARRRVIDLADKLRVEAATIISGLHIEPWHRQVLESLLDFISSRKT